MGKNAMKNAVHSPQKLIAIRMNPAHQKMLFSALAIFCLGYFLPWLFSALAIF
jgi:hypothetical protein